MDAEETTAANHVLVEGLGRDVFMHRVAFLELGLGRGLFGYFLLVEPFGFGAGRLTLEPHQIYLLHVVAAFSLKDVSCGDVLPGFG